jgi:hypothetical protein
VKLGCPPVKDLINRFRWQLMLHDVELSQSVWMAYDVNNVYK